MKIIAIYHKDCIDGTTAAACVMRKYPQALLFPLSHGYKPEEIDPILKSAASGDQVYTVDCVMGVKEFLAAGFSITSIDHHISVREEYKKIADGNSKFTYIFDNSKSGASLTWDVLFSNEEKPELIKLVEDGDLWLGKYGQKTKDLGNYLYMLQNEPAEILKLLQSSLDPILKDGAVLSRFSNIALERNIKKIDPVTVKVGNYKVPFYNITFNKSEAANLLVIQRDCAVGLFTIDGDEIHISLRSKEMHSPSALDIAKILGGGGHVRASGAKMNLSDFFKSIVNN
jgi:uncharacterized protein